MRYLRAALYLRRSTNEVLQADSLNAQDELLRKYAAAQDLRVVAVFQDSASGRTDKRDQFQALIDLVTNDRADFDAILVRDVSRWGRFENTDEAAYYEFLCLTHGVRVIYVEEPFRDDRSPWAMLHKAMKRVIAAEYSRDKARMTRLSHERSTRLGFWRGGAAPFGLRRTLVRLDGTYVQDLDFGTRKLVSDHRVKLAPGPPAHVAIVRGVFNMYVKEGLTRAQIAKKLNRQRIKSPRGCRWTCSGITGILRREAYVGTASIRLRVDDSKPLTKAGELFSEEVVRAPDSWPGIIGDDIFAAALQRLRLESWQRMTHNIRQQLLNLSIPETEIALLERIAAAPSRRREAKVIAEEIAAGLQASAHRAARLRVEELIRSFFSVEGTDDEDLLAVDKHLRVGVASSFPHTLAGGLVWRFHPKAEADVTVCVGLVPRSHEISEWFLVIRTPKRTISPPLKGSDKRSVYPSLTPAQVKRRLKRTIPWARAAQLLREAIGDDLMFDSGRVARRLGWSTKRALYVYDHLLRAGANLIPCKRRKGRRVTVTCEKCGEQRAMPVSHAVRQTTGLCGRCNDRRKKKRKVKITCGECGAVRFVWPSVAKKYSNGRSTTCHVCTMRRGREITARANAAGRAVKRAARRAMEQILKIVAETISARPDVLHAKARTLQRWDKPQVYWTDLSGDRHRLVIVASDDFLKRCPTLNARSLRRVATALSQPEHWKERPPARKADHSWEVVPPVRAISPRAQKHSRSPR